MRVDAVLLGESHLARLSATRFGPVRQLLETASTNSSALEEANRGAAEGLIVVADHQSAGRGRLGRGWESPPGVSLLFSVLLRPPPEELPPACRHLAVAAVSLAVAEGAKQVAGAHLGLKWPNDLVAPGAAGGAERKVAGVLAEVLPGGRSSAAAPAGAGAPADGGAPTRARDGDVALVVGVGLNVRWAPVRGAATSLEALVGERVDRAELLVQCLLALDRLYGRWDTVSSLYREACATLGRLVRVELGAGQGALSGTALDVDGEGCLLVRTGPGEVSRVAAGDVTHATMLPPPSLSTR
ncbi:MAG: biotin--[acetyl-CoA-carboxylase] ligase [Acidimicrobiales bacterium]